LYDAAVTAASPGVATARAIDALSIDRASRIWIFSFGKAATPMATAAVNSLLRSLHSLVGGVVVSPDGAASPYPTLVAMRGDHPMPGQHSFAAAAKIADVSAGRLGNDVAIVLVSGGSTSMIAAPLRGMSEGDLVALFELLLGSGLDIAAMNAVRKRFTRWGAGRLALALAPAATHCLAMSDVEGDHLADIGSGPCVPDANTAQDVLGILERADLLSRLSDAQHEYLISATRGTTPDTPKAGHPAFAHVTTRIVGNNRMAVEGAARLARDKGYATAVVDEWLRGDAATAGEEIARHMLEVRGDLSGKRCVIWGGETTVKLESSDEHVGGGGRCQELALAAARVLHDAGASAQGISILAAGTDGRDGATEAAGAIVDVSTWEAMVAAGSDPAHALASHASNTALHAAGALIDRRDTGTNVNDVVIAVC
jgi:hydroxypyruvate reductase